MKLKLLSKTESMPKGQQQETTHSFKGTKGGGSTMHETFQYRDTINLLEREYSDIEEQNSRIENSLQEKEKQLTNSLAELKDLSSGE